MTDNGIRQRRQKADDREYKTGKESGSELKFAIANSSLVS